ncbi:kynureninase [Croceitalea sp. MTPC9]|uniref:kynureninase n=1 Tax=unclassified Croceitalea TaxID=2632280 RepID=UPI002B386C61|nr:kynureninase [Croceitalea sp. MTPC6]GMN15293.1 kynureninase [Croceitalea sp. MTPC9]
MESTLKYARQQDAKDSLSSYRDKFHIPKQRNGEPHTYLCGNSLGLQPKTTRSYIQQELDDWATYGVEGHFHAKNPWLPYHEFLTDKMAKIVGAKPIEVVIMNTLSVNLHLLMATFYRPTKQRYKILIESDAFPSDRYAVESQLKFHGFENGLVELKPRDGEVLLRYEDIESAIEDLGNEIALILIGCPNYYTGQVFDIGRIAELGHSKGCKVGIDLAHGVGNLKLELHKSNIDFAAWCTYKYLNSGPGSVGGCFIHERHAHNFDLPRFAGWWGHDKETRFGMRDDFNPIPGAEGWQLSNPPILSLAAIRASLDLFDEVGMDKLVLKSRQLTGYLEFLLKELLEGQVDVITPKEQNERGCQLSLQLTNGNGKSIFNAITKRGVIADWREPDVIRIAPAPFYNSFEDVYNFVLILKEEVGK